MAYSAITTALQGPNERPASLVSVLSHDLPQIIICYVKKGKPAAPPIAHVRCLFDPHGNDVETTRGCLDQKATRNRASNMPTTSPEPSSGLTITW